MFDGSAGTRWTWIAAIFASILMCTVIPASALQQTSSTGTTAAKTTSTEPNKASSAAKKTSTVPHATKAASSHKSTAASAKTSAATHGSARRTSRKSTSRRSKTTRARGQQKIDSNRATSIQQALIREHYLKGEPSGVWDAESEAAMRRYQSDHGWQTKEVPDSRALIKLGLGPNNDHLLNPDSAMTSTPIPPQPDPSAVSHAASPVGGSDLKPAATPQPPPAAQPDPAIPPKSSDDSTNPQ